MTRDSVGNGDVGNLKLFLPGIGGIHRGEVSAERRGDGGLGVGAGGGGVGDRRGSRVETMPDIGVDRLFIIC